MNPWQTQDWVNCGSALMGLDPRLGQRLIARGLQQLPQEAAAWFNMGIALHQQRKIAAAIRAYHLALSLPDAPVAEATTNLAQDLLLNGAFAQGWAFYEERLKLPKYDNRYFEALAGPSWQGPHDPRPCEQLVLVAEQGFGDTLQFVRLAQLVHQQGLSVVLFCQPALVPLLQARTGLPQVCARLEPEAFTPQTRWCPLMSLPHRLGLGTRLQPSGGAYLQRDPQRAALWSQRLQRQPDKRLVALHWQGNPKHEGSLYSRGRSMRFDQWLPLAAVPGIEWVAIQKGAGLEQLRLDAGLHFVSGHAAVTASMDFEDTAAILANCDLLISADSGVVHLAGALGVPCWLALRWIPEWRWLLQGDSSAWYDSVRLFRQPYDNDWAPVVETMAAALASTTRA